MPIYGRFRRANTITIVAIAIATIMPIVAGIRYMSATDDGAAVGAGVVVGPTPTAR